MKEWSESETQAGRKSCVIIEKKSAERECCSSRPSSCSEKRPLISSGLSFSSPFSGPADPCKHVKCSFGAECRDGSCLCPSDCPPDLIEPVCVHSKISYISECEMRAAACTRQQQINSTSFVYGHCPSAATTTPQQPDQGSGQGSDDEDDYESENEDDERGGDDDDVTRDSNNGGVGQRKGDPDHEEAGRARGSADDDLEEDLSHLASDLNEKDAFQSKLCRNVICPIGALCKLRKEGGRDEAFCDCRHMCARITQLNLATTWIKSPVCGSNGFSYPNECRLRQHACHKNTTIHILPASNCRLNFSSAADDNNHDRSHDTSGENSTPLSLSPATDSHKLSWARFAHSRSPHADHFCMLRAELGLISESSFSRLSV